MRNERHFTDGMVAVGCALLAILFLITCQQSQQPVATSAPAQTKPATSELYVTFEGPWAIVPDPKDSNTILAIAPKTKSHRFLAFVPGNTELDAGVYDLTIPAKSATETPTFDKGVLRVNVDSQVVARALDRRTERYAIRLPKPEAYVAETRFVSRVGPTYPPDASTEQDFVTAISLRYSATSKTGLQLAGTQDEGGAFKPLLMEANVPALRFTLDPVEVHLHDDECHLHARQAFKDVTHLLGLTLYIDFPDSPVDCEKRDPQTRTAKAMLRHPFELSTLFGDGQDQLQTAGISLEGSGSFLSSAAKGAQRGIWAAYYFFHSEGGACLVAIPVGG
jgi:hypothetical protein